MPTSEGKRWRIEICAECERRLGSPGEPHIHGCETGISRTVEVVPASEIERLERERDELQEWADLCVPGKWWRIEESRADKAEAEVERLRSAIYEAVQPLRGMKAITPAAIERVRGILLHALTAEARAALADDEKEEA